HAGAESPGRRVLPRRRIALAVPAGDTEERPEVEALIGTVAGGAGTDADSGRGVARTASRRLRQRAGHDLAQVAVARERRAQLFARERVLASRGLLPAFPIEHRDELLLSWREREAVQQVAE